MSKWVGAVALSTALLIAASSPDRKDPRDWSAQDVERILADSPWSQPAAATFIDPEDKSVPENPSLPGAAQAGMAGPRGASDGRWDGGVSKNVSTRLPTISVLVRWDSASPVREALLRSHLPVPEDATNYVITVKGLVPAGRYRQGGSLQTKSASGGDLNSSGVEADPERMLEGVMAESKLWVGGKRTIASDDVKLDAATGDLHIFFPRSPEIALHDKEVVFATRFGSLTLARKFKLKDMMFQGKLEL